MAPRKTKAVALTPTEVPALGLAAVMREEAEKRKLLTKYIKSHMKEGTDYGVIAAIKNSKPSLFKPGSEKFLSLFKLTARFRKDIETFEMSGSQPGTFAYICELFTQEGKIVGEGRGVTTKGEKNWTLNNAVKIAEKRAQIDAVLRTGALSDFFTQDMSEEDYDHEDIPDDAPMSVAGVEEDEPTPAELRTRIAEILKRKGVDFKDRKTAEQYVADETQLALVESNYAEIVRILSTK